MKTLQKQASFSALVLSAMLAFSSAAQASAIEQFKSFVVNTKTAKGEFLQVQMKMVNGAAKTGKTSSGTFKFARPGKFIWTYIKPYDQVLQADGDKLYLYDKDLNQVTIKTLGNAIASSPAAILFGSVDLDKNFIMKDVGIKQGVEWLEAIPKTKDSQFDTIGIGMKDGVPVGMELRDSFGQLSLVTLKNFEKNPTFAADQFKFVVPQGADVLRP
ncbi:outer membrane lipoprotein chaperone LolA [Undibacterium flavidum]|uniref:Outer-membrane lipoprotein carrier protein n=1 Tax=Undibacterium flavidum TaxID=2762297 RepID=A0ABR6YE52_9BURK|nr:outer membrane lipoprotein chaperone LolA [Undibacterium flavidum]MBC3874789.1 outer membrane lipoprotein chaperone LolA [Undibacterium flavidum]